MPNYSDRDNAILRTIADRIDERTVASPETDQPFGTAAPPADVATLDHNPPEHLGARHLEESYQPDDLAIEPGQTRLLERDRWRRRARRMTAVALLVLIAIAGTYGFLAGPIEWSRGIRDLIRRDPASSSAATAATGAFSVVRAVVAERVGPDGQPYQVATSFVGRTPIAVLFNTSGGRPGLDVVTTSISGANLDRSCEPMVISHLAATYWCQWETIDPGQYTITIRLNETVVHQLSFAVEDPLDAQPGRAPGRDIKSGFECLRPAGAIERAICEDDALARLEARMDTLYGSVAEQAGQAGRVRLRQQQTAFISARRFKCSEATAAEIVPCLTSATQGRILELEANRLPSFSKATSLPEARRQLVALGWRPVTITAATPCKPGVSNCQGGPEMVVCSAGPPATCRHTWMRHGTIIEVTTTSGEKSQVESVVCRAGCQ